MNRADRQLRSLGAGVLGAFLALVVAGPSSAAPRAAARFVPVWAMVDGRTPVAGATVRIVPRGGVVLRSMGAMSRTYRTGTFVFESTRRPEDFTVVVSGGRAGGVAFRGTLKAVVRDYRSPSVVHANVVTTLVAAYLDLHPDVTLPEAIRRVKRFLELPRWHTIGRDVRRSRLLFHGGSFLDEAARRGGFDRFVGALAKEIDDPAGRTHPFRAPRTLQRSSQDGVALLTSFAATLGEGALNYAGAQATGWLLAQFGLGGGIGSDLAQIQQQLQQLSDELTAIKAQLGTIAAAVVQGTYSQLAADAAPIIGEIDYAEGQLSLLANLPQGPGPPADFASCTSVPADAGAQVTIACNLVDYIKAHLVGQDAVLNQLLVQPAPGADSILVAASKATRANSTLFYDSTTSGEVASVLSYYQAYEAELLNLLVEYDHTLGAAAGSEAQLTINQMSAPKTGYAVQQTAVMKPSFPQNQALDLRTQLVWQQTGFATGPAYAYDPPSFTATAGLSAPWRLPSLAELDALINGWSGASPQAWLETNAGMSFTTAMSTLATYYGGDTCSIWSTDFDYQPDNDPTIADFWRVSICAANGGQNLVGGPGSAIGLAVRQFDPSESYWYGP